jgi:hypothetical protein
MLQFKLGSLVQDIVQGMAVVNTVTNFWIF